MPIGSSFICFLAFWHVTHTEVYSLTPLKFNLGWLNTHVEVYITILFNTSSRSNLFSLNAIEIVSFSS